MSLETEKSQSTKPKRKPIIYARFNCPLCRALGTLCIIKDQNQLVYPPGRIVLCCSCNTTILVGKESIDMVDAH